ncbi:MAG: phosphodiester glycosidase family protein [Clostridia bacterium]|nr:phosphodiester glycosidase family protein [Clostridia bacterium]
MKNHRFPLFRTVSALFAAIAAIGFCGIMAFYILIVAGASEKLQTMWVCTAMTTMDHKYLATLFIPEDTINAIMDANRVDDSKHDSIILNFSKQEKPADTPAQPTPSDPSKGEDTPQTNTPAAPAKNDYISEGYTELEGGVYLKAVSGSGWKGYVMLIEDPMRVKLVDTSKQYTCGENVMTMVENSGAVAGINGGGFQDGINYDSNGGMPAGLLIEDRQLIYPYQSDNTTIYNMIGINENGALVLRHCTSQWALNNGIVSAVTFQPFLVVNGEGLIKNGTGGWGIAPRTAIGQRETGEILFLVVDGRQVDWSIGCDLDVLQEIMLAEKAFNAAMLDGGSSTAMVHGSTYINRPSLGHERWINNAFVVMPE